MLDTPDIILIDKPKGITSFDVIRRLRRELGIKKMGHAGTLDPMATGLMIIGIGSGTKKLHEYLKLPKAYEAEILVGQKTTTGDITGDIVEQVPVGVLSKEVVSNILDSLVGTVKLAVPLYSAIKIKGQPLYKYARKGKQVAVPEKEMVLEKFVLQSVECKEGSCIVKVIMHVGSGTYIRSLAEEIGRRLDYPATLQNLRRTEIGPFNIKDAQKLEK
jgi:tRNA pseudouridine55 synthase